MDNRSLAKKGRYGDTHIRDVYGLKSHVNKLEADIIDSYGFLGEAIVKETGAGTINPKTGMPEYHLMTLDASTTPATPKPLPDHAHPHDQDEPDVDLSSTDYGLESLSKKDFFEDDGITQKPLWEILNLMKKYKPYKPVSEGGTHRMSAQEYENDMIAKIKDFLPKLQGVSEEEKGFAREGFQKDVYGVSKEAGKAGAQMQQAYGSGMGSQMRGAFGAQKDVSQQFKQAEQAYAQDVYGLEQQKAGEFEADVSSLLANFKQGGRVPSKQSFLDVLSKIPDAGGN